MAPPTPCRAGEQVGSPLAVRPSGSAVLARRRTGKVGKAAGQLHAQARVDQGRGLWTRLWIWVGAGGDGRQLGTTSGEAQ